MPSHTRPGFIALWLVINLTGTAVTSSAQDSEEPPGGRFRVGALRLSPAIRLNNVWDDNIFNVHEGDRPIGDFTATFSPAVDASLPLTRVRVSGRTQLDFYAYRDLTDLNSVDLDSSVHTEVPLNRLTPYVSGRLRKARHGDNFEIDALAERRDDSFTAGADVRVTSKASVGFYETRSHLEYKAESLFRDTDLARSLNHAGTARGLQFQYAATPLTTLAVKVEQQRDRFVSSPERNSESLRVEPSVEFKPLALVSGRATIGFRKRTFEQPGTTPFRGTVASVDLQYTLLGRTLFSVDARRDLEYSYFYYDYLIGGLGLSVTQRVGESWEVGGTVRRYRLSYETTGTAASDGGAETTVNTGLAIGYRIGRSARVGFEVTRYERSSEVSRVFGYERLRTGLSFSYGF